VRDSYFFDRVWCATMGRHDLQGQLVVLALLCCCLGVDSDAKTRLRTRIKSQLRSRAASPGADEGDGVEPAAENSGGKKPKGPDRFPLNVHDKFNSQFNKNLAIVNGEPQKVKEKQLEGWTGTVNNAFIKTVFVNQTMHLKYSQEAKATPDKPAGQQPIYVEDIQRPNDQLAWDEEKRLEKLRKKAKDEDEKMLKEPHEPLHPPIKFPYDNYWKGPDPHSPPKPGMVGGRYGPASSIKMGDQLVAPPFMAGGSSTDAGGSPPDPGPAPDAGGSSADSQ